MLTLALRERLNGASSLQVAQTVDNLAIAYRTSDELAETARLLVVASGDDTGLLAKIDAWLETHR